MLLPHQLYYILAKIASCPTRLHPGDATYHIGFSVTGSAVSYSYEYEAITIRYYAHVH